MRDEDKSLMDCLDTGRISTKRELAMYIIGICSQKDWSDGVCLDYILNTCYQLLGTKTEVKNG